METFRGISGLCVKVYILIVVHFLVLSITLLINAWILILLTPYLSVFCHYFNRFS